MNLFNNSQIEIHFGENLPIVGGLEHEFRLVYMDPPFNTGKKQARQAIKVSPSEDGDRKGYKGRSYKSEIVSKMSYDDKFENLSETLYPVIALLRDKLTDDGSMMVHLDYREVHDVKVSVMDKIFGRGCFMNEIIWAYDYGARSKKKWPAKHDTILWYVKDPKNYVFHYDQIDRVPYMAPGLVSKEKAEQGKTLTDVWWNTIVCGKEKTGYPTQKPRAILDRIVKVHSDKGDWLVDPYAGSGSFGEAAAVHDRNCVLIDKNQEALDVMEKRFRDKLNFITWVDK